MLLKSLTEEIRLKPRFKDRQRVSADYCPFTDASLDVTTEVCRCCGAAAALGGQHSHLVLDSVLNGQPMQFTQ